MTAYLRFPTIAGDLIAFATDDDMWVVPTSGGWARRVTDGLGQVGRSSLSSDGTLLAFTSTDELHAEAWVMPAEGGEATRITWLGATTSVRGWTPDGKVLITTDARQPFVGRSVLAAVDPNGGQVTFLPIGLANEASWSGDGGVIIGRNTVDPARWKRYRGGRAGTLWIDRRGDGRWRRLLPDLDTNLAHPMWVAGRVYFVSDHEGVGNIYSCRPDGRDLSRHTDHDRYYARLAQTDGRRIVYQHAGDVWLYDPSVGLATQVPITTRTARTQRRRRFVDATAAMSGVSVHPKGHSVLVEARGGLHAMGLFDGPTRSVAPAGGVRSRLGRWLGDGSSTVHVSDRTGEERLEVTPAGRRAAALRRVDVGEVSELVPSPDGTRVAVTNHRNELLVVELATARLTLVDSSPLGLIASPAWSPDGAWLAFSKPTGWETRSIVLVEVASGALTPVTPPEFIDFAPAWDPAGRYLYFLSARVFDPVMEESIFSYCFPRGTRPYVITLTADATSPTLPDPRPPSAPTPPPSPAESAPASVRIDLDGIDQRVVAVPVPDGRYRRIMAAPDKLFLLGEAPDGVLGHEWFSTEPQSNRSLDVWDWNEQKADRWADGITDVDLSTDHATLLIVSGRRLRAVAASAKPADPPNDEPGRASGWIDLGRIAVPVDPPAEWTQMFNEAWRRQRDHFWTADLSGVAWSEVRDRYMPLLDKVSTRAEFSDLMWEFQGELGTSHAYEIGGDYRESPPVPLGRIGADVDLVDGRWQVTHRLTGTPWDEREVSPAGSPGVDLQVGDAITSVNGEPVGAAGLGPLLMRQAGQVIELGVAPAGGSSPRVVRLRTVADDRPARYRDWVEGNRAHVRAASGGRCGYMHLPDMSPPGYAEFHRAWAAEFDHDALIVDVRSNGGGNVSQLLLAKLAQQRIGYFVTRWEGQVPWPFRSPPGPRVCVTDEAAGSDGDIFSHNWKLMGLGPLVGKRTWGGVIGISGSLPLVDGTLATQPTAAFWSVEGGWAIENRGVEPDHDVEILPSDYAAGRDPQLDTAVRLALRALRGHKPVKPRMDRRPPLPSARLPKR